MPFKPFRISLPSGEVLEVSDWQAFLASLEPKRRPVRRKRIGPARYSRADNDRDFAQYLREWES